MYCGCSYIENVHLPFWKKPASRSNSMKYSLSGRTMLNDAQLASLVYDTDDKIQQFCSKNGYDNLAIGELKQLKVKYFTANTNEAQYIVVRGTSNFDNVKSDILALPIYDTRSKIWLHKGFRDAALGIIQNLENAYPKMQPAKKTIIVGHSLGGAIANILGIYFYQNNFNLDRIITFGQPKITNKKGLAAYSNLPLFRVVGAGDIITCVPPQTSSFTFVHGGLKIKINDTNISYTHFGDAANAIEDDPVSIHMDLDRVSRAVYHKISHYIKRLQNHKNIVIQIDKNSN
jgi:predicted lipase